MHETSKSMIRNFAYIVDTVGFIPNGGRVYYLQRSQPPFLCGMVYEYYEATHDVEFIKEMLPVLEKVLKKKETTNSTIPIFRKWTFGIASVR